MRGTTASHAFKIATLYAYPNSESVSFAFLRSVDIEEDT